MIDKHEMGRSQSVSNFANQMQLKSVLLNFKESKATLKLDTDEICSSGCIFSDFPTESFFQFLHKRDSSDYEKYPHEMSGNRVP